MTRLSWLLLLPLVVSACAPSTRYRRSALVPPAHALAWDGRTAERGTLRLEGALTHTDVSTDLLPREGDSALLVPQSLIEGSGAIAITNGFELGARYGYASYEWARESAWGTPPIPGNPSLHGFGPEARGTIRFGKTGAFALGLAGNVMMYSIPVAQWELTNCAPLSERCIDGWTGSSFSAGTIGRYQFQNQDTKSKPTFSFAAYPSYEFGGGRYGHVFFGLAVHQSFKNDGFSNNANGSMVASSGFVPILGVGYGFHYEYFRVSAMLDYPVTSRESVVYYTGSLPISFFVALGVDLPLWGKKAGTGEPAAPPARAPAAASQP